LSLQLRIDQSCGYVRRNGSHIRHLATRPLWQMDEPEDKNEPE
jgi:hypothetical protein